ncbi:triphosphoribosyl-dephospho-CoA synthase MdcB [Corticibacter populi]|uniref:Probable 2-(5''-triphosphoribosyl)-3'-dephosphocoenzyme-A synthase n=1 Tax=Corticibacter populi TaxID=1550736 RepID=A0A3M6QUA6_9BURK|nr:triphosphoribosyl-dephospho-CoA synthase MdcB [Corticibacter populi]RMX06615.1 triphosphoribosyl-dephospho-CoA synthase MdcB [Corticibacter populi]RZS31816.1 triphosphoribosyl-dephospho-CoA synthase [Corticibacter populi]
MRSNSNSSKSRYNEVAWPVAPSVRPWRCAEIGRAATLALHDELALAPKPGLVSFEDSGSHDDMDAHTFMRSLFALRHYFVEITELGAQQVPFAQLQACGIAAEQRMLRATGGINTHRGAIFMLGLLCAAAGSVVATGASPTPPAIRAALQTHWGAALAQRARQPSTLPGGIAVQRYGLRGAMQEAALAFPAVFEAGWPAWQHARLRGLSPRQTQLHSFFSLLAVLDDSNLVHRGGLAGLAFARAAARDFLQQDGAATAAGWRRAGAIHRSFVARRLSPGGTADALSATCWLARLQGAPATR